MLKLYMARMDGGFVLEYFKYVVVYVFFWLKRRYRGFLNRNRGT